MVNGNLPESERPPELRHDTPVIPSNSQGSWFLPTPRVLPPRANTRIPLSSRIKCNTVHKGVAMGKRGYEQLSLRERIEIYRLHADGKSLRFIAGVLERNVATISRELKRNSKASKKWAGGYDPQRA